MRPTFRAWGAVAALLIWGARADAYSSYYTSQCAGCHTTSGFGQDVQSLGRDIQKNAK